MERLLRAGADPNRKVPVSTRWLPLHHSKICTKNGWLHKLDTSGRYEMYTEPRGHSIAYTPWMLLMERIALRLMEILKNKNASVDKEYFEGPLLGFLSCGADPNPVIKTPALFIPPLNAPLQVLNASTKSILFTFDLTLRSILEAMPRPSHGTSALIELLEDWKVPLSVQVHSAELSFGDPVLAYKRGWGILSSSTPDVRVFMHPNQGPPCAKCLFKRARGKYTLRDEACCQQTQRYLIDIGKAAERSIPNKLKELNLRNGDEFQQAIESGEWPILFEKQKGPIKVIYTE